MSPSRKLRRQRSRLDEEERQPEEAERSLF